MGMGRNSSRIASRRIQNSSAGSQSLAAGVISDDDADDDWLAEKKKRKRDKNSPRRSRKCIVGLLKLTIRNKIIANFSCIFGVLKLKFFKRNR